MICRKLRRTGMERSCRRRLPSHPLKVCDFPRTPLFGSSVNRPASDAPVFAGWHHEMKGQGSRRYGGVPPMRSRPQAVTVAALLLVLLSLFNFPWPCLLLFPGVESPPAFVIYTGFVLVIVGLVVAVGLWMMKAWSYRATIGVCVLNLLSGAPGVFLGPTVGIRVLSAVLEVVALLIIVLIVRSSSQRALEADQPSRVR